MIKFKAKTTVNNKSLFEGEGNHFSALFDAEKEITKYISQMIWQYGNNPPPQINKVLGEKGQLNIVLSWECTTTERAPARPKNVIAAEKAARAAKVAAKYAEQKAQEEKWEKERQKQIVLLRQRVKHQVDHAFALGKHGTEPAAKFITCGHCNAPAVFLGLNQRLAGAQVINEDAIVGVVCQEHDDTNSQYKHYTKSWVEKIPCSKLEFFYDGIRQIAVKA